MRLTGKRLIVAAVVLVAAVVAYFVLGGDDDSLPLRAQVTGTVNDAAQATGTGVADAPFGSVSFSAGGSGQFELNCVVFDGDGRLVTAAGTLQLRLPKPGRACLSGSELEQAEAGGDVNVTATVEATGIDGSLLGRHGRLKARGTYNVNSGAFTVTLNGPLRH